MFPQDKTCIFLDEGERRRLAKWLIGRECPAGISPGRFFAFQRGWEVAISLRELSAIVASLPDYFPILKGE